MSATAGFGDGRMDGRTDGLTDKEELGILLQIFKKQIFQLLRQGSIVTVNGIPIKFLHERLRFCQMNTCYLFTSYKCDRQRALFPFNWRNQKKELSYDKSQMIMIIRLIIQ